MRRPGGLPTTQTVLDAADELNLPEDVLARVLRCSGDTVRLYRGGKSLVRGEIHREAAAELLEAFRLIRNRVGFHGSPSEWIRNYQVDIGRVPLEILQHDWGVGDLLDRLRGSMPKPRVPMPDTTSGPPSEPMKLPNALPGPAPATRSQHGAWRALAAFAMRVAAGAVSWLLRIRRWIWARR